MLTVESLSVSYEGIKVLWDISISVAGGSITAIIGSNGAGKSTILNTIAGLLRQDSGNIFFEGKNINNYAPFDRVEAGISLVPERRRLFPYLSVQENLEIGAYKKRARVSMKESLEWVNELFPILKRRRKQLAGTLSGGEQQMLAIARGLMSKPRLLMLDEPSLGLSPKIMLEVFNLIREIKEAGVTIFILEQNVHHALKLAKKAFVLESGRITMEGSGEELMKEEYIKKAYLGL
jgi:branched-chain amino acid transport system ATP-binding protein